jgi:hypothetical protein
MDRLERDPERRGELNRGYDVFMACPADGIVREDSIDWLAQRMQDLQGDGLIAHGPVSEGVREPTVWDDHWLQSAFGWRVTAPGRADAALHRRETGATLGAHSDTSPPHDTDVFICHASEDKDTVARPLADALTVRGWSVWLDELELTADLAVNSTWLLPTTSCSVRSDGYGNTSSSIASSPRRSTSRRSGLQVSQATPARSKVWLAGSSRCTSRGWTGLPAATSNEPSRAAGLALLCSAPRSSSNSGLSESSPGLRRGRSMLDRRSSSRSGIGLTATTSCSVRRFWLTASVH